MRGLGPFVTGAQLEPFIYSVSHRANRKWLLGTAESGMKPAYQAERYQEKKETMVEVGKHRGKRGAGWGVCH